MPRRAISIVGFKHKDYPYICTAPASGFEDPNLPFYIDKLNPMCHMYDYSPVQVTDRFGPCIVSEEYDTLYIVTNCSLWKHYDRECEYKLEIIDPKGKMYCVYRKIPPQSFDAFWLSELLSAEGIPSGQHLLHPVGKKQRYASDQLPFPVSQARSRHERRRYVRGRIDDGAAAVRQDR